MQRFKASIEKTYCAPCQSEIATVTVVNLNKSKKTKLLLTCTQCHTPLDYILTGYRPEMSWMDTFCSIFSIHNETCNVWTHVIPFFVAVALVGYESLNRERSISDTLVVITYCFTMAINFSFSSLYHLGNCKSKRAQQFLLKVDFTGILVLLWGSNIPMIYFGFSCEPTLRTVYFVISTFLVLSVWTTVMLPNIPGYLPLIIFICLVLFGWCQAINEYFVHDPPSPRSLLVPIVYAKSFSFYIVGVIFYASHFPERVWPGAFDFVGNSHNLWHIFVALGAFFQYWNVLVYQSQATNCTF